MTNAGTTATRRPPTRRAAIAGHGWVATGGASLLLGAALLLAGCGNSSSGPASTGGDGGAPAVAQTGKQVFNRYCASCHLRGLAGAIAVGDPRWQQLAAGDGGVATLVQRARDGVPPGMPPKGLCRGCSDAELENGIRYMMNYVPGG